MNCFDKIKRQLPIRQSPLQPLFGSSRNAWGDFLLLFSTIRIKLIFTIYSFQKVVMVTFENGM